MQFSRIACIGGGRIVRAFLGGLIRASSDEQRYSILDPDSAAREALSRTISRVRPATGAMISLDYIDSIEQCMESDLIILAVPGSAASSVLQALGEALRNRSSKFSLEHVDKIFLSFVPKLNFSTMHALLGEKARIIRMNPNAASLVGAGFNPVAFSETISEEEKTAFLAFVRPLGVSSVTREENLERYAMISAMGPTYFLFQMHELMRLGEHFGLSAEEAKTAVVSMTRGTAALAALEDYAESEILDLIPSKPLAKEEDTIRAIYERILPPIYEKLKA